MSHLSRNSNQSVSLNLRAAYACIAFVASGFVTVAIAQPSRLGGPPEGTVWGLGIGVMSKQQAYTGMDRKNSALPMIQVENKYVRVFGPSLEVKLPRYDLGGGQNLDFRLVAKHDGSGYEASDSAVFTGMAERKAGFWTGAKLKWNNGVADVSAEWLADASRYSKGQRLTLGVDRNFRINQSLTLTPHISARWQDDKYVDYYYGVRQSEAIAGRPFYAGKAGVSAEVGVRGMYRLDANQSLMFGVGVTSLSKEVKNSPLVDRSTENQVMLGYLYRF